MVAEEKPPIYLDYNGTTPIDKEACEAMSEMMYKHWGNPSSSHYFGVQAKRSLENARRHVAALIGAEASEIIFMCNGTETINHALKGLAQLCKAEGRNHIVTQASEHVAVLEVCKALELQGCDVTYLPVDADGLVSPDVLEAAITPKTFCVSIMHSNNETGTLQPINELAARVKKAAKQRVYFHCDASQSLGKMAVDVNDLGVDMMTIAGHKLYAPKGVGALYKRSNVPELPQLMHGAGQEGGRRASTENVIHIVGLGKACEVAKRDLAKNEAHLKRMRDTLHDSLVKHLGPQSKKMRLNGPTDARLSNTLNVSFHGVEANTLLDEVSDRVAASAGAACHSDEVHMSHVLKAMGKSEDWAMGTCRFTVGRSSTNEEMDQAASIIAKTVLRLLPANGADAAANADAGDSSLKADDVRLTKFTHGMGCACKIRPQLLERVLSKVRTMGLPMKDPNVLFGLGKNNEDACVYKLTDDIAVVGTVDFFTPVCDDATLFGKVAAANALSDVYAMGAKPIFALNIVGFPSNRLPDEVLARILSGGQDKCTEAGCSVLGGHTVEDTEPKFGLAVIGLVHPQKVWPNNAVKAGDALVLTKAIGAGILSTAVKRGILGKEDEKTFVASMEELNKAAAECGHAHGNIHACTDVTGFGLLGHLMEMLTPSGENGTRFCAVLRATQVPLMPSAKELASDALCVPGGTLNNMKNDEAAGAKFADDVPRELRTLLSDAQSSGGLLFSVPSAGAEEFVRKLKGAGLSKSAIIGEVKDSASQSSPKVHVVM
eukprot:TRINITY_DN49568_c0_g1_i2.p1 TRINITY_DN49568_c0_g1~~TRINITY_DN49568_c0_g1_i2.p1  ORF type:complete len:774 (-),score=170.81 TRINITY_DN49568_c0_g1_i2:101-2422(-)